MNTFDEHKVARHGAGTSSGGQFAEKAQSAPEGVLAGATEPLSFSEDTTCVCGHLNSMHVFGVSSWGGNPIIVSNCGFERCNCAVFRPQF
jgi:hypothetical protein